MSESDELRAAVKSTLENTPGGVTFRDRTLVVAQTGAGKSTLLNHLFTGFRCQRLLLDTKGHEWSIAGVEPVRDVAAIDWSQPIIHYVDRTGEVAEYDELFAIASQRPNLVVGVHELADICENNANKTPSGFKRYMKKGRTFGRGLVGASQRPVEMPTVGRSEVQHIFVMVPPVLPDDLQVIAPMMGRGAGELGELLHQLQDERGPHSFLWYDVRARALTFWAPLPPATVARTIVKDRT